MRIFAYKLDECAIHSSGGENNRHSHNRTKLCQSKFKIIVIANLIVQLLLPISLSFAPMSLAAAPQQVFVATVPYELTANETIYSVAKKHHLTVDELKKLNQFRAFSKPFNQLKAGDEIDVPAGQGLMVNSGETDSSVDIEAKLANGAMTGARLISDNSSPASMISMGRSAPLW